MPFGTHQTPSLCKKKTAYNLAERVFGHKKGNVFGRKKSSQNQNMLFMDRFEILEQKKINQGPVDIFIDTTE